jgi:hypothetical protein
MFVTGSRNDLALDLAFAADEEDLGVSISCEQFLGHGHSGEEMAARATAGEQVSCTLTHDSGSLDHTAKQVDYREMAAF